MLIEDKNGSINSHPISIFSGRSCVKFSETICARLNEKMGRATIKPWENGEIMVQIEDDVRGKDVFVILPLCRQRLIDSKADVVSPMSSSGVNDCLMELLIFGDTLRRASAYRITAVIPYFGYARQDRKAIGRTPITARLLADLIVTSGFNRVLTMDLHADQIQGFFPNTVPLDHLTALPLFKECFKNLDVNELVLLFPDVNGTKKSNKYRQAFPQRINLDIAIVDKQRDNQGKVKANSLIGNVKNKTVYIYDDMIATAGTMLEAMRIAIDNGAKEFYLGTTHGEFVGNAIDRLKEFKQYIREIHITDTIPSISEMKDLPIKILPSTKLFSEAIRRIHRFESVSALFN